MHAFSLLASRRLRFGASLCLLGAAAAAHATPPSAAEKTAAKTAFEQGLATALAAGYRVNAAARTAFEAFKGTKWASAKAIGESKCKIWNDVPDAKKRKAAGISSARATELKALAKFDADKKACSAVHEISALSGYTGGDYSGLNALLRAGTIDTSKASVGDTRLPHFTVVAGRPRKIITPLAYLQMVISGLNALPGSSTTPVYRGTKLPDSILSAWTAGATVSDKAFYSTSTKSGIKTTAVKGVVPKHQFDIHLQPASSGRCKAIRELSAHADEEEVLCLPGTQFKVCSRTDGKDIVEFVLGEVGQSGDACPTK